MSHLTSRERFARMYAHQQADRVPVFDSPWGTTLARWHREGMPKDVSWVEYFDLDHVATMGPSISPRYPVQILEETEDYKITTTEWGVTLKNWKNAASTPEFIDFAIKTPDDWLKAKRRMTPSRDRVKWDSLKASYAKWRSQNAWIEGKFWFGFDVTHSWTVGTERVLIALVEDPQWLVDMWNTQLDMCIAMFEMLLAEGYTVDAIYWPDDLGYKGHTFMSPAMYRELLKPVHARAIAWAHSHGIKARLHSCGDIRPLIPDFIDAGLDCLNPLEVKAGVDPLEVKRLYGHRLVLHGGTNAVLWDDLDAIDAQIRSTLPKLMHNGGYIWATDHSIPDTVGIEGFRRITQLVKELGSY